MPNLTKNIATRAAQRESLPNSPKYCCQSRPKKLLLPRENCCRISPKILLRELPLLTKILLLELIRNKNCCRVSPKYCCEKLPRENICRISPTYFCQSRLEKLLPNLNKILLRKLPREKTWDDSWQNQSSQDSRWNQHLLNHSY